MVFVIHREIIGDVLFFCPFVGDLCGFMGEHRVLHDLRKIRPGAQKHDAQFFVLKIILNR